MIAQVATPVVTPATPIVFGYRNPKVYGCDKHADVVASAIEHGVVSTTPQGLSTHTKAIMSGHRHNLSDKTCDAIANFHERVTMHDLQVFNRIFLAEVISTGLSSVYGVTLDAFGKKSPPSFAYGIYHLNREAKTFMTDDLPNVATSWTYELYLPSEVPSEYANELADIDTLSVVLVLTPVA